MPEEFTKHLIKNFFLPNCQNSLIVFDQYAVTYKGLKRLNIPNNLQNLKKLLLVVYNNRLKFFK